MYLLKEAYDKHKQTIYLKEAQYNDFEYYCPICDEKVIAYQDVGFKHIQYSERDEQCALKLFDIQDSNIANKYKSKPSSEFKFKKDDFTDEEFMNCVNPKSKVVKIPDLKIYDEIESYLSQYHFTTGQRKIIDLFLQHSKNGVADKKEFVFSGAAGSGKSFTMSILINICHMLNFLPLTATLTGKASQVLREKGVDSNTIHSLMYIPDIDSNTGEIIGWEKNESLECDIFFVDEFSFLGQDIVDDIKAFNKITIFMGDLRQLPSITAPTEYFENNIDIELTEIVRQSAGNPIIKWANYVRKENFLNTQIREKTEQGVFAVLDKNKDKETIDRLKLEYDQMICGTNKTRKLLNNDYRNKKGFVGILQKDESVVVLKNDKKNEVFNGQIFKIEEIIGKPIIDKIGLTVLKVKLSQGIYFVCLNNLIDNDFDFNKFLWSKKGKIPKNYHTPIFIDYSYALSCHRMQGSEADNVLIFLNDMWFMYYRAENKEKGRELMSKIIYTSITRSKKKCVVVM